MDIRSLKRDAAKVNANWVQTRDDRVVAKKECKIYIPSRFAERGLATIGAETSILGLCAIVIEDKYYGVCNVNAMMRVTPSSTNMVMVDEVQHYEFTFDAGATVIANTNLVKQDILLYEIYSEIIAKGHIPWYLSYEDLGKLFTTAKKHAGVNLVANNTILEMVVAAISRNPKDRTKYYRHVISSMDEQYTKPPEFIAFRSPMFGATNTTAKLIGAYFEPSMNSALVNPSEKTEGVERLLRA